MFTTRNWVGLVLVLTALTVFGPRCKAQVISCSSDDGRRHYCPVDAPGRIRLAQQRSESACQEGYSWGHDRHGIWVDRGCRADFEIVNDHDRDDWRNDRDGDDNRGYRSDDDYNRRAGIQAVTCSSDDMNRHYCPADTHGGVRLYKQLSDARCQEGSTWGYDDHGIWVDRGCRADFQTGMGGR